MNGTVCDTMEVTADRKGIPRPVYSEHFVFIAAERALGFQSVYDRLKIDSDAGTHSCRFPELKGRHWQMPGELLRPETRAFLDRTLRIPDANLG